VRRATAISFLKVVPCAASRPCSVLRCIENSSATLSIVQLPHGSIRSITRRTSSFTDVGPFASNPRSCWRSKSVRCSFVVSRLTSSTPAENSITVWLWLKSAGAPNTFRYGLASGGFPCSNSTLLAFQPPPMIVCRCRFIAAA
jgi:hypothetical protein